MAKYAIPLFWLLLSEKSQEIEIEKQYKESELEKWFDFN